jgi:hypothetical protein
VDAGSAAGSSSGVSGSRRRAAKAGEPTGIRMVVDIWMMPLRLRGPLLFYSVPGWSRDASAAQCERWLDAAVDEVSVVDELPRRSSCLGRWGLGGSVTVDIWGMAAAVVDDTPMIWTASVKRSGSNGKRLLGT